MNFENKNAFFVNEKIRIQDFARQDFQMKQLKCFHLTLAIFLRFLQILFIRIVKTRRMSRLYVVHHK